MMGRNHLIAGSATAAAAVFWVAELSDAGSGPARFLDGKISGLLHIWPGWLGGFADASASPQWAVQPVSSLAGALGGWMVPVDPVSPWGVLYLLLAAVLFGIGSLLPDIDSKRSLLGRHIHVPGPHHGITHTDWFLTGLLLLSFPEFTRVLVWLWLGAVLHCWMDGLSRAGRVRFYPLGRHKTISLPNGGGACVVTAGRRQGLYRVGQASETIVLAGILALCTAGTVPVLML